MRTLKVGELVFWRERRWRDSKLVMEVLSCPIAKVGRSYYTLADKTRVNKTNMHEVSSGLSRKYYESEQAIYDYDKSVRLRLEVQQSVRLRLEVQQQLTGSQEYSLEEMRTIHKLVFRDTSPPSSWPWLHWPPDFVGSK